MQQEGSVMKSQTRSSVTVTRTQHVHFSYRATSRGFCYNKVFSVREGRALYEVRFLGWLGKRAGEGEKLLNGQCRN